MRNIMKKLLFMMIFWVPVLAVDTGYLFSFGHSIVGGEFGPSFNMNVYKAKGVNSVQLRYLRAREWDINPGEKSNDVHKQISELSILIGYSEYMKYGITFVSLGLAYVKAIDIGNIYNSGVNNIEIINRIGMSYQLDLLYEYNTNIRFGFSLLGNINFKINYSYPSITLQFKN